jgi:hypothetical protein
MSEWRGIESAPVAFVVLHIAEDGSYDLKVWGDGRVQVLWVDERAAGDRVYCQTSRETDAADLAQLVGADHIGHAGDGHLDDQTVQAIRAMSWRLGGGKLAPLPSPPPRLLHETRKED